MSEEIKPTTPEQVKEEESFELSTKRKPFAVTIDGTAYELRHMTGDMVGTYRNGLGARMKFGPNGKPSGFSNYKGMESALVTLCLFPVGSDTSVSQKVIDSWPQPIIDKLFKKCRSMNALDDEGEEKEKKD